jgi:hypothetical protein
MKADDCSYGGRLSRSVGAQQGDALALPDVQVHVPQRSRLAMIDSDIL